MNNKLTSYQHPAILFKELCPIADLVLMGKELDDNGDDDNFWHTDILSIRLSLDPVGEYIFRWQIRFIKHDINNLKFLKTENQ